MEFEDAMRVILNTDPRESGDDNGDPRDSGDDDSASQALRDGHRARSAEHVIEDLRAASTDDPPNDGAGKRDDGELPPPAGTVDGVLEQVSDGVDDGDDGRPSVVVG